MHNQGQSVLLFPTRPLIGATSLLASAFLLACGSEPTGLPSGDDGWEPGNYPDGGSIEVTVQYIQRLPVLDYVWDASEPTREGWPSPGETVTWRAHLRNWQDEALTVEYLWLLDGNVEADGEVTLPAGGVGTVDLPWTWTFERHLLRFVLDPENRISEESEGNNTLLVPTDALSVGFYVEESLYEFFRENQHRLAGARSTSWEDWAHRHIERMNQIFASAVHPDTPEGVLDRVRLDRIHVVPDGSIQSRARPNDQDRSVDLIWGFQAEEVAWCMDLTTPSEDNYCYLNPTLIHELGHARYLVDVYAQEVVHAPDKGKMVELAEAGEPVVGSRYMPVLAWRNGTDAEVHRPEQVGLMSMDYDRMDPYSAMALNLIAGHRATRGNYNDPENLGVFMNDLPARNRVTLRDQAGTPLSGAHVEIHRSPAFPDPVGQRLWKQFDDLPDQSVTAEADGSILVGRNPFGGQEPIDRWNWSNTVIILRVEDGPRVGYAFMESLPFNMEFWRGHTDLGTYALTVTMHEGS